MMRPIFKPFRITRIQRHLNVSPPVLLDVGCGNQSPSVTKRWLPDCTYHGIDRDPNILGPSDKTCCERFLVLDLDDGDLSDVTDNAYDVIIMSHVVEHLRHGERAIGNLIKKLKAEGLIYIEVPSERSLRLPSGVGTLNFFDDKTHVRFYSLGEIGNILLDHNLVVLEAGRRREWFKIFLFPLYLPLQIFALLTEGRLHARGLWDMMGFADYILARKAVSGAATEDNQHGPRVS